jgi:multiple sugar transport system ATP-binding protein
LQTADRFNPANPETFEMAEIRIKTVAKRFGDFTALHSIDMTISDQEFMVLLGASGCGKTTLLRIIAGLETPSEGEVWIGDKRVDHLPPRERGISMVFQNYAVFPHLTVFENIAFGLRMRKLPRAEIERRVNQTAELMHIEQLLKRYSGQLSGGQRQRVAVARALAMEPDVILMDEPLSNLDALLRLEMRAELKGVLAESKTTTIYVTHDQVEAMTMADTIVVLRMGRIEQVGTPLELYNAPANVFVAGFIGSPRMNFLEATVVGRQEGAVDVRLDDGTQLALPRDPGGARDGDRLTLGIRPEHLAISASDGEHPRAHVAVNLTEPLGGESFVYGSLQSGEPITIKQPGQIFIKSGAEIAVSIDPALCHLFDREGWALAATSRHRRPSLVAGETSSA